MRLNAPLVTSFVFDGEEYAIDLAFDTILDAFDNLEDKTLRDYEKAQINIAILVGKKITGEKAVNLWNHIFSTFIYRENKALIRYDLEGNPMPSKNDNEKVMDLKQDANFIYASFKNAYNIDLFEEQGKMHWDIFQSLLAGLPSSTIMQRIIKIRNWKESKGDPPEYKKQMRELQEVYALEKEEVDE